jgi:hypothetical protein
MADRTVDVLLIGGGIASASVAQTLRDEGFAGSILLVGRELDRPYHRPPITKGYLQGTENKEDGFIAIPDDVEVLTRTSVMAVDTETKTAKLSTKEEVAFTHAVIATGAMVRRLPLEGANLDGLHYLRARGNADALRTDAEAAERVVLVGGSYVGCETAASLKALGKQCTILMQEEEPFDRHFGTQAAQQIRGVLETPTGSRSSTSAPRLTGTLRSLTGTSPWVSTPSRTATRSARWSRACPSAARRTWTRRGNGSFRANRCRRSSSGTPTGAWAYRYGGNSDGVSRRDHRAGALVANEPNAPRRNTSGSASSSAASTAITSATTIVWSPAPCSSCM